MFLVIINLRIFIMKNLICIIAIAVLPMTAIAKGNTNEVPQFINAQVGQTVFTSESNTLSQPSRRDVAGAVLIDNELTRTVDENGAELEKE